MKWIKVNESLKAGFTTNIQVTSIFESLIQAIWRDAQDNDKRKAFHEFKKKASDALMEYWNA